MTTVLSRVFIRAVFLLLVLGTLTQPSLLHASGEPMIIEVDTTLSDGTTVTLPLRGNTDVEINWGDGSATTTVTSSNQTTNVVHSYASEGTYIISITGTLEQFGSGFSAYPNADKITAVTSFGDLGLTSLNGAFNAATNLTSVPTILPGTVTDLLSMFQSATSFNQNINSWDTSNVTSMSSMFNGAIAFNQPLDSWDTSNVTSMSSMFNGAIAFNQPLDSWDTSNVTSMSSMFNGAIAFNQPLDSWDTSNVTSMSSMFNGAIAFNQPLNSWDTSSVTNMSFMFRGATSFNRDLSSWCVALIGTKPFFFDASASAWTGGDATRPQWGSCYPFLSTKGASDMGTSTATFNATITADNKASTTLRGFEYSTDPTFATGVATTSESGTFAIGSFSLSVSGLTEFATYYVRAFAQNSRGFSYARNIVAFNTAVPTVRTEPASAIATSSVTLNGTLVATGGQTITTRGFIYSTDKTFTTGVATTSESGTFSTGAFSLSVTDLATSSLYYYRAFVETATDVVYGASQTFGSSAFILVVDTSLSAGNTATLPLRGNTDVVIDWGDGATTSIVNANQTSDVSYTYASEGEYSIAITGTLEQFGVGLGVYPNADKITAVTSFGDLGLTSLAGAFRFASNITAVPLALPSTVTDLLNMFSVASVFNQDISSWDTSNVTDMSAMFRSATTFNQPLNSWDTSNVTSMSSMFNGAIAFNQPLDSWDTSNVTSMSSMFYGAAAFNQPLDSWDTSNVTSMSSMFMFASTFNQPLNSWDTSSVTNMNLMFRAASTFNQPLSGWDTSNVTDMSQMFYIASTFNQPLSSWDTSNVTVMSNMFQSATSFNRDLSSWCVALIGTTPFNFDASASAWTGGTATRPQWGSCYPFVSTNDVSNIATSTATFNGTITADNQASTTLRGFEYSTDPTFATGVATTSESGTFAIGSFSLSVSGLTEFATYYVRAFAQNSNGFSYASNVVTFNTAIPTVRTDPASDIALSNATLNGTIIGAGGQTITTRGFIYSTDKTFTTGVATTSESGTFGTGAFSLPVTDLATSSLYYYRAFVETATDIVYGASQPLGSNAFILVVDTSLSAGNTATLPLRGNTDVLIDWGDGATTSIVNANQTSDVSYTYASEGEYSIAITGTLEQFGVAFSSYQNADKITAVTSFGDLGIASLASAFTNADNLTSVPQFLPSTVTNLLALFSGASVFNQPLNSWDTSNVTDMTQMFRGASVFNQPLNSWDTSNVTSMSSMFNGAIAFNQPLDSWDTSNVTSMSSMFNDASVFNQDISNWDVSNVTDMTQMFNSATFFNRDLSSWCVSQFASEPSNFDDGATAWTGDPATRPQWGTCPTTLPSVRTNAATAITATSLTLNGAITNTGNSSATLRGFEYTTDATFTTGIATTSESGDFTTGTFSTTTTGLTPETTYYYRAFAQNAIGLIYGEIASSTQNISVTGSSTLGNHDAGQADNAFNFMNKTGETLFTYKLTPDSGESTVTETVITLTGVQALSRTSLSNIALYRDINSDALLDVGDTHLATGTLAINELDGTGSISFSDPYLATTSLSQNYLVVADWLTPAPGASMKLTLAVSGLSATDTSGAQTINGAVDTIHHFRNNRGGGSARNRVSGEIGVPGDGIVTGGTNDGGEELGGEPNFEAPTGTGDPQNQWLSGANAFSSDGTYASENVAGESQSYDTFGYVVVEGNTITGIEVKLEASIVAGTGTIEVALSWDGGVTTTAVKATPSLTNTDTIYTLGGSSDTWGRSWSPADFSDTNFRVRLIGQSSDEVSVVQVDAITVRVYSITTGGGTSGGSGEL